MSARDAELLEAFVRNKSDEAFSTIVTRYVDLVHSASIRQVRDAHLAQDVTQATFIVLTRRAASVSASNLPGWLMTTAHFCAKDALKRQGRRVRHEHRAATMRPTMESAPTASEDDLAPHLDKALSRLREREKTAVVMRFLKNLSPGEVAAAMGISIHATQKIIARALPKLRAMLERQGIILSSTALLTEALLRLPIHSAPAGFAGSIRSCSPRSLSIANGAMNIMSWIKIRLVGALALAILLTGGSAGVLILNRSMAAEASAAQLHNADSVSAAAPETAPATNNLVGFESPFLELVGCRIKQTAMLDLSHPSTIPQKFEWTEEQFSNIKWSIDPAIATRIRAQSVEISQEGNTRTVLAEKAIREIHDGPREAGVYTVAVKANGADDKLIAAATANITVKPLSMTQIQISDVQADDTIDIVNVLQYLNETDQPIQTSNVRFSDMYDIRKITDDQGNPIEFRKTHKNGMYWFFYRLNQPIAPGQAGMGSTQGVVTQLVKILGERLKAYSFDHSPGVLMPVRRIELFRLPAGATLVSTSADLQHKVVNGQMQMFFDVVIPAGGHHAVSFQYRLGIQE